MKKLILRWLGIDSQLNLIDAKLEVLKANHRDLIQETVNEYFTDLATGKERFMDRGGYMSFTTVKDWYHSRITHTVQELQTSSFTEALKRYVNTEQFIDDVINRIKTKQLP